VFDGNRHVRATFIEPEPIGARISSFVAPAEELPDWFYALMAGPPQVIRIALPEGLTNYGAFELETEQRGEVGEVWDDFLLKLAILTFFCALVSTLVYFTVGRALEPLPKLSAAFERLGGGDYGVRVAESGPTELAKLCSGFNEMADRLGQMERRNQQLNEQLATVQEEERADLARDLHDEVSPFLFSVDVDASTIRQMAEAPETDALIARTDAIREAVAHMKKHVKSILGRLRPTVHLELGLANAIETLVASWQLRNPDVVFNVDVTDRGCGQKLDAVIHGIVREAISNAFKHSKPTEIDVQVTRNEDDDVRVLVRDDGGGLKPSSLSSGFGLIAMRERVTALGGTIDIGNREDRAGVKVDVRLPIRESYAAFDGSADLGSDA
jgi:two-component system sensor histidine kinase UhpB